MITDDTEDNSIETCIARLRRDELGIVWFETRPDVTAATIDDVRKLVAAIAKLGNGNKVPVIADGRQRRVSVSNQATRKYFAHSDDADHTIAAFAMLVNSPATLVIANFFLKISKPVYPTRIFNNEAEAIAWLKGFVE